MSRSSSCWDIPNDKKREQEDGVSESTVSQVLLWLWDGNSSGIQEGKRPPLEAGTRELVRDSRPKGLSECLVNCSQIICEMPIGL
jgi:hypothetical protein